MSPKETSVLSDAQIRVRNDLEEYLLQRPYVLFASIGFAQLRPEHLLVSLGTDRPDLVHVQAEEIWVYMQVYLQQFEHRWNVEFQILKGRVRG